jgi:TonB-linked SusC/RagA family outer membrane protein
VRLSRHFIMTSLSVLAFASLASAQTGRVTGVVTEAATGKPLSGVQVYIEGTNYYNLTNAEGRYLLQNVRPGTYAVIANIIGYAVDRRDNLRVDAGQVAVHNFSLRASALSLQELVVTGVTDPVAGVKLPFSISKVTKENLTAVPTTNSALGAIQGKVAGATIVRSSGQPGSGVSIQLRTPTSVQASNSPMFVVDGVILASTIGGTTVDLESLDIESVEVVKGAAAASLYGSRAANGVVQITTSRGKNLSLDQTRITVRSEYGATMRPRSIPFTRSHQFLQNAAGEWVNAQGQVVPRTQRVIEADNFMDNPYIRPTYDNFGTYFRNGQFLTNTVNLSYSGRSTNFLTSFNMYNEQGSLETSDGFKRYNLRVNLDHRLGDKFNFSVSAFHNRYNQDLTINQSGNGLFWDLLLFPNDVNLSLRDPTTGRYLFRPDSMVQVANPLYAEELYDEDEKRARTLGSIDLRYSPFNWLNLQANFSYDRSDENYIYYEPKGLNESITGTDLSDGFLRMDNTFADALNASVRANVTRQFGKLNTRTTVSGLIEREKNTFARADGSDFWVIGVPDLSVAATRSVSSSLEEIRATAYFGETSLDYAGKYIGNLRLRRDGSSLFGPDARWQTYYGIAAGWRMSLEPWFPWKNFFNEFKPRYARGTAGVRPSFAAQYETWSVSSTGAVSKTTLGNRALEPGHTLEQEFGIDLIALNKYQLQLTYATQVSSNQIIQLPQPAISGYPNQWFNTGEQTGRTYEATFEAQLINRPNFTWNTTFVADKNRSKITQWNRSCFFSELQNICGGASLDEMWGERFIRNAGELPSVYAGAQNEFQVNDDGYLVWVGAGNSYTEGVSKNLWGTTGTVNGRTLNWGMPVKDVDSLGFPVVQKIGNSLPKFGLGWLNNLNFRGLAVHTHFHAQIGGEVYNGTRQRLYQHERSADLDQADKPVEQKKTIAYYQHIYNANVNTNHFVEDGTFLKLRAISLQYRISPQQLQSIGLRNLSNGISLGVIGRNLFTITNYKGFDPEVGTALERLDSFDYPNSRTVTATVEITF